MGQVGVSGSFHCNLCGCPPVADDQVVVEPVAASQKFVAAPGATEEPPAAAATLPVLLPGAPASRQAAPVPGQGLAAVASKKLAAVVGKASQDASATAEAEEDAITREELVEVLEQQGLVFEEPEGGTGGSAGDASSAIARDKAGRRAPGKVKLNLDLIEVIVNTEPASPGSPFVSRKDVWAAVEKMSPTSSPANASTGRVRVMSPGASPSRLAATKAAEGARDASPQDRKRKRKGTGFLSKGKLLEVLQSLDADQDADEAARALSRNNSDGDKPPSADQQTSGRMRQGTGFVRKEHLKQLLGTYGVDDEDDSEADSDALRT